LKLEGPAVQRAFLVYEAQVVTHLSTAIQAVYSAASRVGLGFAARQTSTQASTDNLLPTSSYLEDALARVHVSLQQQRSVLSGAVSRSGQHANPESDVRDLVRTSSFRARLALQSAAQRGFTDAQDMVYTVHGVESKMWQADFDNHVPCPTCQALHGTIVSTGGLFPGDRTYADRAPAVFGDLAGPPRHPNCRCILVPVPAGESPVLEVPDVPAPTSMTAADVRSMSQSKFRAMVSVLASVVARAAGRIRGGS